MAKPAPENGNDDLKAKMREALDRKKGNDRGVAAPGRREGEGARLRGRRRRAEDAPPQGRWRGFVRFPTPATSPVASSGPPRWGSVVGE